MRKIPDWVKYGLPLPALIVVVVFGFYFLYSATGTTSPPADTPDTAPSASVTTLPASTTTAAVTETTVETVREPSVTAYDAETPDPTVGSSSAGITRVAGFETGVAARVNEDILLKERFCGAFVDKFHSFVEHRKERFVEYTQISDGLHFRCDAETEDGELFHFIAVLDPTVSAGTGPEYSVTVRRAEDNHPIAGFRIQV